MPAFQQLAERCGLAPTWLGELGNGAHPGVVELLRDVLARARDGAVGLHLHARAFDLPPMEALTDDDARHHPFLGVSDPPVGAKIGTMAGLLEETFQQPLRSHRAGRRKFDADIARWPVGSTVYGRLFGLSRSELARHPKSAGCGRPGLLEEPRDALLFG